MKTKLTVAPNPRVKVKNWRELLAKVESTRISKNASIEAACMHVGIAYTTYFEWKRRLTATAKRATNGSRTSQQPKRKLSTKLPAFARTPAFTARVAALARRTRKSTSKHKTA